MESYVLNDMEYDFKPLEIFVPDPNYKVDEKELEKSIEKNKAIIARAREPEKINANLQTKVLKTKTTIKER